MKVCDYIVRLADPYKVIACYTIFLVVQASEREEPSSDDLLLSEFCPNCELTLEQAAKVFTEFDFVEEDQENSWRGESFLDDIELPLEDVEHSSQNPQQNHTPSREFSGTLWWGKVLTPLPTPHSLCQRDVNLYLRDLARFELWAMQMWDSSAKVPSGLLSGNSNQLGDYDGCLAVERTALGIVRARYCLAHIDLQATNEALPSLRTAVNMLQAGAFVRSKHSDPGHFAPRWSTVHWGVCIPATCDRTEIQAGLRNHLQAYQLPGVRIDAVVAPGMCYTAQRDTTLPLPTLVTLGFFGGILMLAVVSTMVDQNSNYLQPEKLRTQDRALLAFSLRRTFTALVSCTTTDDLPVVHGVRSLLTALLFVAHKLMPLALTPYSNRSQLTQCSHSVMSAILRASSLFTDSFLHLSGVLTAYNLSREIQRGNITPWHHRLLARIIRLTPALFAVVIFYAFVLEHLGSGPQWHSSITVNADLCKASMWRNILYVQNFYLFEDMCAPHTHQLALDMQLSLAAPLAIQCLHRWPRRSLVAAAAIQMAVAALRYYTHLRYRLSDFIYHNISLEDLYRTANMSYSQSVLRATPYILGLLTGYLLQQRSKLRLTQTQAAVGWFVSALLAGSSMFYPSHLARPDAVYDPVEGAWYAALSPVSGAAALSWLIVACSSGYGGWLHWLLSCHWMVILSRLSYAIYLTQFIVFFYYVGSIRSSQEFGIFYTIGIYEVAAVLLLSLLVTLLFDLPMQEIKSILLSRGKSVKLEKAN